LLACLALALVVALALVGPVWAADDEKPEPTPATAPAAKPVAKKPPPKATEAKRLPPPRRKVSADNPARFPADI
jgi:hypothetical protein